MAFPVRKIRTAGTVRPSAMGGNSDLIVSYTGNNTSRNYHSTSKIVRSKSARSYFTSPRPSVGRPYVTMSTSEHGYLNMAHLRTSPTRTPGELYGRQVSGDLQRRQVSTTPQLRFPRGPRVGGVDQKSGLPRGLTPAWRASSLAFPTPSKHRNGQTFTNLRPETTPRVNPTVQSRPQTAANGRYFHYHNGLCKLDSFRAPVVYGLMNDPRHRDSTWQGPCLHIHKMALLPKFIQCY